MKGHYCNRYNAGQQEEESTWIGKPWRRLEYLRQRTFYKGECVDTVRSLIVSLGLCRFGWHFHAELSRAVGADYSDNEHQ